MHARPACVCVCVCVCVCALLTTIHTCIHIFSLDRCSGGCSSHDPAALNRSLACLRGPISSMPKALRQQRHQRRMDTTAGLEACEDVEPGRCKHFSAAQKCASPEAHTACRRTCGVCRSTAQRPRVFVYPNTAWELGMRSHSAGERIQGVEEPWALAPDAGTIYGSYVAPLLYQRLKHYSVPPEQADFFFAFQTPHKPPFHTWTADERASLRAMGADRQDYMGNEERLTLIAACSEWYGRNSSLLRGLYHLTPLTEHRHIVIPRWHYGACGREEQFSRPHMTVSKQVRRLLVELDVDMLREDRPEPPTLYHVPFLSHVRWSRELEVLHGPTQLASTLPIRTPPRACPAQHAPLRIHPPIPPRYPQARGEKPPWRPAPGKRDERRVRLISFCGSSNGSPEAQQIREKVIPLRPIPAGPDRSRPIPTDPDRSRPIPTNPGQSRPSQTNPDQSRPVPTNPVPHLPASAHSLRAPAPGDRAVQPSQLELLALRDVLRQLPADSSDEHLLPRAARLRPHPPLCHGQLAARLHPGLLHAGSRFRQLHPALLRGLGPQRLRHHLA